MVACHLTACSSIRISDTTRISISVVNIFLATYHEVEGCLKSGSLERQSLRFMCRRECSQEQDLYEGEGSSIGQKKSNFHIAAAMASANPMGSPGTGMILQRHTTGGGGAPALTTHYISLGNALASGEAIPGETSLVNSHQPTFPTAERRNASVLRGILDNALQHSIHFWMKNKNLLTDMYWAPNKISRQKVTKLAP